MSRKKLRWNFKVVLAEIISLLLNPLLMLPLVFVVLIHSSIQRGESLGFLLIVFILDLLIPFLVLTYQITRHKIRSGWNIERRQERVPLLIMVVGLHLVAVCLAWYLQEQPMAVYITSLWLLTVAYAFITAFWKVSIHTGVFSSLVTFLVITENVSYIWLYVLLIFLIWARVTGKHHTLLQTSVGALLPMVVIPIAMLMFRA